MTHGPGGRAHAPDSSETSTPGRPAALRALLVVTCVVGCASMDVGAGTHDVVDVDDELLARFDDAALFCDLRLMDKTPLSAGDADKLGDLSLKRYASTLRREAGAVISRGPHAGQTVSTDTSWLTNACILSASTAEGEDMLSELDDGFCRADFNHCLGRELEAHAGSLPSGSAQSRLKAALLRVARERLQAAALEYVASLGFYERACVSEPNVPIPGYSFECKSRLLPESGPSYLQVAHARLVESVERIAELAELEAELRVDVGDREARETVDELSLMHASEPVAALFGENGSRTAAVAVIYGPPDQVTITSRPKERRLRPVAAPVLAHADEHAARALELMREHRVPTVFARSGPTGPVQYAAELSSRETYDLLDHRIAAARFRAPYDEAVPSDPSTDPGTLLRSRRVLALSELRAILADPIELHESVLRTEYGITLEDVGRAQALILDAYEAQLGNVVFEPQAHDGPPGGPPSSLHYLALAEAAPTPRPAEMLAAAFSDEPEIASADALAPLVAPLPPNASASGSDFYSWDLRRVDTTQEALPTEGQRAPMGAAGVLHLVRVHLLRLASIGGGFIDVDALTRARALIEEAIGAEWSEYDSTRNLACQCLGEPESPQYCPNRDEQALYQPCSKCFCDLYMPEGEGVDWELYQPPGAVSPGAAVAVHWVDDVRCLLNGREPGSEAECTLAPSPLPLLAGPETTRIGTVRRTYRLPEPPTWATHHFVLWANADGSYRLADVVPVDRPAGVHPLGGVLLDAAANAWRYDPWRPDRAAASSRGGARDLIPPLESELISDSDRYEDSFATYLADARHAVEAASRQLAESRDDALESRLNDVSGEVLLEEAALIETGALADLCGDLPGCRVGRSPPQSLQDLGILGPPPDPPDLGPYTDCREVRDGLFTDFHEQVSRGFNGVDDPTPQAFVREHLKRALGCAVHTYLSELSTLRVSELPLAVGDALATGADPEFSLYFGRVREHLLRIYGALDRARSDLRRLQALRLAAEVLIDAAALQVDFDSHDARERDLCVWSDVLHITADALSLVSSAITTAGAAGGGYRAFSGGSDDASWRGDLRRGSSGMFTEGASITNRTAHQVSTDNCTAEDAAEASSFRAAQQAVAAMSTLVGLARSARDAARGTYYELAELDAIEREARIAARRRDVARLLAESDSVADVPEWQAHRGFSQRRAQRSLQRAQQAAFVARRAIEFRLGVDLRTMTDPEPLTPPPSTWADSVFDVGSAVLSVPEREEDVSIAAEELSLYVDRLTRFVEGYPIARRFRDAGDVQVLDLGALLDAPPESPITDQLLFTCADHPDPLHPEPLPAGRLPGVTSGPPCEGLGDVLRAELHFQIPAELDRYLAERLAAGSFNYRHELLAPNLVGTAVLDCERALDRAECYGDGNVRYTLRHEGPFVIESFDRRLEAFFMEPGVILDGRALVAERSLTTPLGSHDRSLVTPYYREELRGRPLSGLYSLVIPGRPEIEWAHLERIQLLVGYRYWTRQE